jgi:hypothetical protein
VPNDAQAGPGATPGAKSGPAPGTTAKPGVQAK